MRVATALVLGAILLTPLAAALPDVEEARCKSQRVPCGYIYPRILIEGERPESPPLVDAAGLTIEATLAFEFDPMAEGLALDDPRNPIVVTFEFPRKPAWAVIEVEPAEIPIPILPTHMQPDASDPQNVKMPYRYATPITIRIEIVGQPVLPDGVDVARLYVFAKSTESGLYKPGYGIREIKAEPAGAIHEADLGPREVLAPQDPGPLALRDLVAPLAPGLAAKLDLPATAEYWRPATVGVSLDPPAPADVTVALVDETDHVHALVGPRAAPFTFNLTLPRAGEWRFVVVAEGADLGPAVGAATLSLAPPTPGSGHRMPRDFRLLADGTLARAGANAADPAAQDEALVPFAVFDGASAAEIAVGLTTADLPLDRGLANVNVAVLDPTGAVLQQGTIDPLNPVKRFPVGALPGPGLYHARIFGGGVEGATWNLAVQVIYDAKPVLGAAAAPWRADVARLGQHNATLELAPAALWTPTEARLALARADGAPADGVGRLVLAALDAEGRAASSTGTSQSSVAGMAGTLTLPRPGSYLVVARAASVPGSATQWGRGLVARTVVVGDPDAARVTYPAEFSTALAGIVEPGGWRGLGSATFPVFPDAGEVSVRLTTNGLTDLDVVLYDATATEVDREELRNLLPGDASATLAAPAPGLHTLVVRARAASGADVAGVAAVAYAAAPSEANPLHVPAAPPAGFALPAAPWAAVVAVVAALAAARRRA